MDRSKALRWTSAPTASATAQDVTATSAAIFQRSDRQFSGPRAARAMACPMSAPQLVTEAAHRLDPVGADLLAQPLHTQVDDAAVPVPAVVPDIAEQRLPVQHDPRIRGELQQQPQL